MAFLVTGGAGFIGSNIVEELVKRGGEITVLDSLHTGSLDNLKGFKDKIRVIEGGMEKLPDMKLEDVTGIFHFGIPSSSPMYKEDPLTVGRASNDMIRILEFARKNDSRIVFASSSSVYNGQEPPHKEDMAIKVTDYYTEARLFMERLALLSDSLYGVKTIGLRLFSVYGPREESKGQYANLVSQFLWCMKNGECPLIYGDGKQRRDFTYVKDVVDAAILAMDSKMGTDIFNIGTGKNYDLNELVGILNKLLGKTTKPEYIDNPIRNYVACTLADTTKAESVLKFKAKKALEDGIREYM